MAREIPKEIVALLEAALTDDGDVRTEDLSRVIYFLTTALAEYKEEPYFTTLQSLNNKPALLKAVVQKLADDCRSDIYDAQYRQFMYELWSNYMKEGSDVDDGQRWQIALMSAELVPSTYHAFMRAVANLSHESFLALQSAIQSTFGGGCIAQYLGNSLVTARKAMPVVRVTLVVAYLAFEVFVNIRRWWKEEITGVRCLKNIIDSGLSVAAGVAGGVGGEMLGVAAAGFFSLGPVGIAIAAIGSAIAGSVLGATAAQTLSDKLTQWFFGIPKSEALENAYNFMEVPASSTNSDINKQFRRLASQYHPDKGVYADDWTKLQYSIAAIRQARGEL